MAKYPAIFLGRDGTTIDDLSQSFIIYDYPSDVLCGKYVGIASDYVLKRQGVKHKNGIKKETIICSNILEATKYLASIKD